MIRQFRFVIHYCSMAYHYRRTFSLDDRNDYGEVRFQTRGLIDGVAVPIVNNMQNTRTLALPQGWIENRHRAGLAA